MSITDILNDEYDFVVSLGYDCHTATMLRKLGLRSCSSPFDWVTGSGIEDRLNLLETHFENFLKKENLQKVPKGPDVPDKGNEYYKDLASGLVLYHDFRKELPFDVSYADVCAKYSRRIERLYENIAKANRALFVWCNFSSPTQEADRLRLEARLANIFPGKDVRLLVVTCDKDFSLIKNRNAVLVRRRVKRLRFLIKCLTWPYFTRAARSAARRRLEHKWGLE